MSSINAEKRKMPSVDGDEIEALHEARAVTSAAKKKKRGRHAVACTSCHRRKQRVRQIWPMLMIPARFGGVVGIMDWTAFSGNMFGL